jgi:hypothetical protein
MLVLLRKRGGLSPGVSMLAGKMNLEADNEYLSSWAATLPNADCTPHP